MLSNKNSNNPGNGDIYTHISCHSGGYKTVSSHTYTSRLTVIWQIDWHSCFPLTVLSDNLNRIGMKLFPLKQENFFKKKFITLHRF